MTKNSIAVGRGSLIIHGLLFYRTYLKLKLHCRRGNYDRNSRKSAKCGNENVWISGEGFYEKDANIWNGIEVLSQSIDKHPTQKS